MRRILQWIRPIQRPLLHLLLLRCHRHLRRNLHPLRLLHLISLQPVQSALNKLTQYNLPIFNIWLLLRLFREKRIV
uniref:Uncharacterized protein n=1 Tax=Picea sitchensis TaxID=3332 RepID=A9NRY6_PICSI|nr:unknown [Picea sitchensis]